MRRSLMLIGLVAVVVAGVLAPAADPPLPDELARLVATIVGTTRPSEDTAWAHNVTQKRLSWLSAAANRDGLQGAVLEWLLGPGRDGVLLADAKQRVYIALCFWTMNTTALADCGDLFAALLAQAVAQTVPNGNQMLATVIPSLTHAALAVTDQDGRTAFEFYVDRLCADNDLNAELAVMLAEGTPDAVMDRVRDATLTRLPARIWTRVFHRRNANMNVHDALGMDADIVEIDRLHTEMVLSRIRFADLDIVDDEVRHIFAVMDPIRFVNDSCREIFNYDLDGRDTYAIYSLALYFGTMHTSAKRTFLDSVPFMFATKTASYQIIVNYIDALRSSTVSRSWQSLVLRRLLSFHLEHDPAIGLRLADHYRDSERIQLLRVLLRHRFQQDELTSDADVLRAGLQLGAGVGRHDDDDTGCGCGGGPRGLLTDLRRPSLATLLAQQYGGSAQGLRDAADSAIGALILGLTLRTLIDTNALILLQTSGFMSLLSNVVDERLRAALVVAGGAEQFETAAFQWRLQAEYPLLYDRLGDLLPDKIWSITAADTTTTPSPPKGQRLPAIRVVDDITGEYEFAGVLGGGMFGTVYRAYAIGGGRRRSHELAIKVQPTDTVSGIAETEFMRRFCAGPRPVPGLVRLLDAFRHGSDTYLVMERVRAVPLMKWKLPGDATAVARHLQVIIYQMLAVLDRLHRAGWQHGDLQHLNNFLINPKTGALTLIDFGMSQPLPGPPSLSPSDQMQLYMRLSELLDDARSHLDLAWWEPAPPVLTALEAAVQAWPYRTWTFGALMSDPVFDPVRSLNAPSSSSSDGSALSPTSSMKKKMNFRWASRVVRYCQRLPGVIGRTGHAPVVVA